jgi:predicted nucleic acid-binding protein
VIVLDTSVALAFMDRGDADHGPVRDWMDGQEEELVTTPLIVAELDHMVARQGGPAASRALRGDFDSGAYLVQWWPAAIHESIKVAADNEKMELGLADASLIALAARLKTTRIATLDERHFRAVKPLAGAAVFTLLPADR